MKLNVLERLLLLQILPGEGNLTTLRIVNDLSRELSFTEEEHEQLDIRVDEMTGRVLWEEDGSVKDVTFGPKATEIMRKRLEELDKQEKLRVEHLSLCDKFGVGADG